MYMQQVMNATSDPMTSESLTGSVTSPSTSSTCVSMECVTGLKDFMMAWHWAMIDAFLLEGRWDIAAVPDVAAAAVSVTYSSLQSAS